MKQRHQPQRLCRSYLVANAGAVSHGPLVGDSDEDHFSGSERSESSSTLGNFITSVFSNYLLFLRSFDTLPLSWLVLNSLFNYQLYCPTKLNFVFSLSFIIYFLQRVQQSVFKDNFDWKESKFLSKTFFLYDFVKEKIQVHHQLRKIHLHKKNPRSWWQKR